MRVDGLSSGVCRLWCAWCRPTRALAHGEPFFFLQDLETVFHNQNRYSMKYVTSPLAILLKLAYPCKTQELNENTRRSIYHIVPFRREEEMAQVGRLQLSQ